MHVTGTCILQSQCTYLMHSRPPDLNVLPIHCTRHQHVHFPISKHWYDEPAGARRDCRPRVSPRGTHLQIPHAESKSGTASQHTSAVFDQFKRLEKLLLIKLQDYGSK
jgi:hypothetical protein